MFEKIRYETLCVLNICDNGKILVHVGDITHTHPLSQMCTPQGFLLLAPSTTPVDIQGVLYVIRTLLQPQASRGFARLNPNCKKCEFNRSRSREGTEGERRYRSTLPLTSALDGVLFQCHAPAVLTPGKESVPTVQYGL
jgi:hypothetical protein